ncbi:MAG: plastocyanin/azurin family copper-binding protein [Vicinamibacterales bacterium]
MGFLGNHRRYARIFIVFAAAAALGVGALLPLGAGPSTGLGTGTPGVKAPREVVLVARDMSFYLDGAGVENPTLRFNAGEEIRLVLRNEESGVTHDFAVSAWKVATRRLQARERDAVIFRVPDTVGRYDYLCNPHASMMRGIIEVE